jgi:NACHT domain/HEAT repeats
VEGDGNQVIGQVTGGNVFNIAGNVNILSSKLIAQTTPQIDWLDRSYQLLTAQKHLTTNGLLKDSTRNFDHIHVPLGLIERKDRPKVKEEPSPERGSEFYQTEYTETKRFEHQAFLADVVRDRVAGKHIAIIGEPGAGKTTILTKIGEYLIRQAEQQPEQPFVVAWVSLAAVGDRPLQKYLQDEWLQKVCEDDFEAAWQELRVLRRQGRVWLLLDGLDEMSGDALGSIYRDLGQAWAQNLRVAMTCRINQWEAAAGGNILTNSFDVYRTLDYSYQTSQGEDQVEKFISNWFGDKEKEVANQIRRELDAPGKERIKDLVKNPLRLTLLCASWEQDNQALPETQADLYQGFVNYLYGWKAKEFQEEVKLKDKLNLALGELAKAGLNRTSINDGAVRRFRFTASEIRELWQDLPDTLLPVAEKLGWLNVVGKEKKEDLYAFYHPTFQEYFAACSIDDWDYFLPRAHIDRPVPCQDGENPYRVFEQEWRQPMLLWFGRENVANEDKEAFIEKLTTFQDGAINFHYYRAYCLAAICVSEFEFSQRTEEIVQQIIEWAFGYFNTDKQKWRTYLNPISSLAKEMIPFIHHGYAIVALMSQLNNPSYDFLRSSVALTLGQIDEGNQEAISALIALSNNSALNDYRAAEALGQIAMGNQEAISALIALLNNSAFDDDEFSSEAAEALGRIAVGDQEAISALIALLNNSTLNGWLRYKLIEALGQIAEGNQEAISALISLFNDPALDNGLRYKVAEALGRIAVGNQEAIAALITILSNSVLNDYWLYSSVALALGQVDVGNQGAITALITILSNPAINDYWLRYRVGVALGQVAVGNQEAIAALSAILNNPVLNDYWLYSSVALALGQVDVGNQEAIAVLISLLKDPALDYELRYLVALALGQFDVGDQEAIAVLISLLKDPALDSKLSYGAAHTLGQIGVGNQETISALIAVVSNPAFDYSVRSTVAEVLCEISTRATMPSMIWQLKNYVTDEVYNSERYDFCFKILFHCAQVLPYSVFYTAWHKPSLPLIRFSPETIKQQLNCIACNVCGYEQNTNSSQYCDACGAELVT